MSLKAYEDVCLRAELFGQPKPNKDEFLEKNKHLDIAEFEEVDIRTAENTAMLDENMKAASGGLSELNTILTSTQTKINKLKGVCGSLTNFFRVKLTERDNLSYSSGPAYVGQTNFNKDYVAANSESHSINTGLNLNDDEMMLKKSPQHNVNLPQGGINRALDDLQTMQNVESTSLLKQTTTEAGKQISKLDQMIFKADRAQSSLEHQNKQMKSVLR